VRIDTIPPDVSQTGGDDDPFGTEWHADDVTVVFHTSDGGSGTRYIDSSSDSGVTWEEGDVRTIPAPPDGSNDGEKVIIYRAHDWADNESPTLMSWVRIDTQAPVTADDAPEAWVNSDTTVHLDAIDLHSGVLKTEYRIDGGAWRRGTSVVFAAPSDGSNDGRHTLQYRSVDRAVNIEDVQTVDVCIDTQAPQTHDDYDGAPHLAYPLVLTSMDPEPPMIPGCEVSGVASTEFRVDGGAWKTGTAITLRRGIRHRLAGLDYGYHWFEYRSIDVAGNYESVQGLWIEINPSSP
jgi:hypothetical protein